MLLQRMHMLIQCRNSWPMEIVRINRIVYAGIYHQQLILHNTERKVAMLANALLIVTKPFRYRTLTYVMVKLLACIVVRKFYHAL